MMIDATLWRALRSRIREMIWACTVTSRAVVGSSATRTDGSPTSDMAITARCRIPPENSCGYWEMRSCGLGIPTSVSMRTASLSNSALGIRGLRISTTSDTWRPILIDGLSDVIGFWNTILISEPRNSARRASVAACRSSPLMRMCAASILAVDGRRPMAANMVTDLPEPDSPTKPTFSPA